MFAFANRMAGAYVTGVSVETLYLIGKHILFKITQANSPEKSVKQQI